MGSAWATGDRMYANRRNREWMGARLAGYPLYDVDNTAAVTVAAKTERVTLSTSIADIYAVPSSTTALFSNITITNTHSAAVAVSLYMIEPGQTAASVARTIWLDTLQAGERVTIRVPYILAATAKFRGLAATGSVVSVTVSLLEFSSTTAGLSLKIIEGVALSTSLATIYTAPGSITQALLLAATFCNTDTVTRTPEMHVIPSGGSAAVSNQVWKDSLVTKETVVVEGYESLVTGDFVQAKASAGSVVSLRLTVLEVT